jgi:hypothetical protein
VIWLMHMCDMPHSYVSAHGGDQTWKIWISRMESFPVYSFEWRGLPFTPVKTFLKSLGFP